MNQYTKMLNKCIYCGATTERIVKGLCPNCYARAKNKGELDFDRRNRFKKRLLKSIDKLQRRLRIVEDAEEKVKTHKGAWDTQFYIYVSERLLGKTCQEIADKYGVTKQCVNRILNNDYYRKNEYEKKTDR